jgi:DNA repair exonuclease SbcCD ATPase subunit
MRLSLISILVIVQCEGAKFAGIRAKFAGIQVPANFTPPSINFKPPSVDLSSVRGHVQSIRRSLQRTSLPSFLGPVKAMRRFLQRPTLATILQDRILELDRKVRAGKEEARQLRVLLNEQRNERRKRKTTDVKRSVEVENVLKEQISVLSSRLEELSGITGEMEALLKQEKAHVVELEQMLESEREEKQVLLQKHRDELDELYNKLMGKLEDRSNEVEQDKKTIAKLTKELADVRKEAQQSLDAEIVKNLKLDKKREEILQIEKAKNLQLEKERQEAQDAVEKEKNKMRKLVKVLAEKEKQEVASSSNFSTGVSSSVSSKRPKTTKVSRHRGGVP